MEVDFSILVETALNTGVTPDQQPFYAQRDTLERVAIRRSQSEPDPMKMVPSRWHWLHGQ